MWCVFLCGFVCLCATGCVHTNRILSLISCFPIPFHFTIVSKQQKSLLEALAAKPRWLREIGAEADAVAAHAGVFGHLIEQLFKYGFLFLNSVVWPSPPCFAL